MDPLLLRSAVKRGFLIVTANWPIVLIDFAVESLAKLALAFPVVGGALIVTAVVGTDIRALLSNGVLDTKKSFIESLTSGKLDYFAMKADIQSIRIKGDVGIIRGRAKVTVSDKGQALDLDLGYVDVWLWKDGRWQMTAWQSARLPGPAAATPNPPSAPATK